MAAVNAEAAQAESGAREARPRKEGCVKAWLGTPIGQAMSGRHTTRCLWVTGAQALGEGVVGPQDSLMGLKRGAGRRVRCVLPQDRASN